MWRSIIRREAPSSRAAASRWFGSEARPASCNRADSASPCQSVAIHKAPNAKPACVFHGNGPSDSWASSQFNRPPSSPRNSCQTSATAMSDKVHGIRSSKVTSRFRRGDSSAVSARPNPRPTCSTTAPQANNRLARIARPNSGSPSRRR